MFAQVSGGHIHLTVISPNSCFVIIRTISSTVHTKQGTRILLQIFFTLQCGKEMVPAAHSCIKNALCTKVLIVIEVGLLRPLPVSMRRMEARTDTHTCVFQVSLLF